MHRMSTNWTWTLNSQKYPVYTTPEAQILLIFSRFPDTRFSKMETNQKCTE